MSAQIISGLIVSQEIRGESWHRVRKLFERTDIVLSLAVIMVGDNPASEIYVRNKIKACGEVGIHSVQQRFEMTISTQTLRDWILELNANPTIHGILVQLPLPAGVDIGPVLRAISPDKDVDGFDLYNVSGLVVGDTVFPPCTPYGVICLHEHEGIELEGLNVVVVGASNIVGKPMTLMLMQRDATVCICHAKTQDLAQFTILADILVVAAGQPNLILPLMVKTNAAVFDVGINRMSDGRLGGDVDFAGVRQKASFITTVPGGVGPMTVTMLQVNTISSAERMSARLPETLGA